MPSQEDIDQEQELLATYRRTLRHLLSEQAKFSAGHVPAHIANGIAESRANIQRIKTTLHDWGVNYEDHPEDKASDIAIIHLWTKLLLWLGIAPTQPDLASKRRITILVISIALALEISTIFAIFIPRSFLLFFDKNVITFVVNFIIISISVSLLLVIIVVYQIKKRIKAMSTKEVLPAGYKISSPGALLTILFVFFPWILYSCSINTPPGPISGFDLMAVATSSVYTSGAATLTAVLQFIAPFMALLSGLIVISLCLISVKQGYLSYHLDGTFLLLLGIISLLGIVATLIFGSSYELRTLLPSLLGINVQESAYFAVQFGLYGTAISLVAVVVGAHITRKKVRKTQ